MQPSQEFLLLHFIICSGLKSKYASFHLLGSGPPVIKMDAIIFPKQAGPTLSSRYIPLHSSSIIPYTISMWDLLPEDIVEVKSINRFKVELDESMQDKGPSVDDH